MDTGGKDGTIKGVFAGVNPQGCQVWSFKAPSSEEAAHDFLWRYHQKAPSKNNKWYRNLVVARTIADTLEAMDPRFPAAEKGLDKVEVPD
jgi:polyphosphate kinase 2 (PPK2 family)